MNILQIMLGCVAGVVLTVAVYPYILQRRARKLLETRPADVDTLGDPTSNYLALLMFQVAQAYDQLHCGKAQDAQGELANILASYAGFLTMKRHRSESEQGTLDAIRSACGNSDVLRCAFDREVNKVADKPFADLMEEMERNLANPTPEAIRRPADESPKTSL